MAMGEHAPPRPPRGSLRINAHGWVYLALTFSVAIGAGVKGNNLLLAVFSLLAGIFAVCGILTVLSALRLEVSRIVPAAVHAGELFAVTLRIRNAKRLWPAFCLKFEDRLSHEGRAATLQPTAVWLPVARGGERIRATYYATAHQRGWARLGPFAVTSEFTPGLFTYRLEIPVEDEMMVYPRRTILNRRLLNPYFARSRSTDALPSTFTAGDEEFAGLREYRPGDNPRRIHWKMSARVPGRLMVREFEDPRVRDAVVFLETFIPNANDLRRKTRLERAISFSAALSEALLSEDHSVTFRAFGPDPVKVALEPRAGALEELLHALALLRPTHVHRLDDLIAPDDEGREAVLFVVRISDDPLPWREPPSRTLVIAPADLRRMMAER
jgi:uncharacterized protein (DUF58 family)